MDVSWIRSVWDATRPTPASAEDERAFAASVSANVAVYGMACALVLNALHLAFWPTDRFLLYPDARVAEAVAWFRAVTFTTHGLFVVALLAPALRRRALPLFMLTAIVNSAVLGRALARMGPLDQPYFYMSFLVPLALGPVLLRIVPRVLLTSTLGASVAIAYLVTRPSERASPFLGAALGCLVFAVLVSVLHGHILYLIARRAFFQGLALRRATEALHAHSAVLEERVTEQTGEIRRLADHLERASEDERAHLSRELHDELGQQLTALRYTLADARRRVTRDPARAEERLDELEEILAHLASVVRNLVSDLRPQVLDERGLGAAVEWLLRKTEERAGIPCALDAKIDPAVEVSSELSIVAFRIVQESLTNVVRHARAGRAEVSLAVDPSGVHLTVADDGQGIEPAKLQGSTGGGFGLLGMRERARARGGTLTIESRPGAGTVVRAELPLKGTERVS